MDVLDFTTLLGVALSLYAVLVSCLIPAIDAVLMLDFTRIRGVDAKVKEYISSVHEVMFQAAFFVLTSLLFIVGVVFDIFEAALHYVSISMWLLRIGGLLILLYCLMIGLSKFFRAGTLLKACGKHAQGSRVLKK
jgi:hypothetical protein